jgi:hypothetical protein
LTVIEAITNSLLARSPYRLSTPDTAKHALLD